MPEFKPSRPSLKQTAVFITLVGTILSAYPALNREETKQFLANSDCFARLALAETQLELDTIPIENGLRGVAGYWSKKAGLDDLAESICAFQDTNITNLEKVVSLNSAWPSKDTNILHKDPRITISGSIKVSLPDNYDPTNITVTEDGFGVVVTGDRTDFLIPGFDTGLGRLYLIEQLGLALGSYADESHPQEKVPGFSVSKISIAGVDIDRPVFPDTGEATGGIPILCYKYHQLPLSTIYREQDKIDHLGLEIRDKVISMTTPFLVSFDGANFVFLSGEEVLSYADKLQFATHGTYTLIRNGQLEIGPTYTDWNTMQKFNKSAAEGPNYHMATNVLFSFTNSDDIYFLELPTLVFLNPDFLQAAISSIEEVYEGEIKNAIVADLRYTASIADYTYDQAPDPLKYQNVRAIVIHQK